MALSITAGRMMLLQEIGFLNKIANHYDLFVLDVYLSQYLIRIGHDPAFGCGPVKHILYQL